MSCSLPLRLLVLLCVAAATPATDEDEFASFDRAYEYCSPPPLATCVAIRFRFDCPHSNACEIVPISYRQPHLLRFLDSQDDSTMSAIYKELVDSFRMLENTWKPSSIPVIGPMIDSFLQLSNINIDGETQKATTTPSAPVDPFVVEQPTPRPDPIAEPASQRRVRDTTRQTTSVEDLPNIENLFKNPEDKYIGGWTPQFSYWDPLLGGQGQTPVMPPYYYHKLFDTVAKVALTDAIVSGFGWTAPVDMSTMPVNAAAGTVAISAVPVLHPNILINGGVRKHPDEHEHAKSGAMDTLLTGASHHQTSDTPAYRSSLSWKSEPAEWGRAFQDEGERPSAIFSSPQSKLFDLISPTAGAGQIVNEMARISEAVGQGLGLDEDVMPQVASPTVPLNLRNTFSTLELMNAVENKAMEFVLSMARPLVKAGSIGLAPSEEIEGMAAGLGDISIWDRLSNIAKQQAQAPLPLDPEAALKGPHLDMPATERRLQDSDLGAVLQSFLSPTTLFQLSQEEPPQHMSSDTLPWIPLDSVAGTLPAWFAEALIGPYALLFEDLVKVAQEAYVRMQLVVDAFTDEPIPVTSHSLQSFTNQMSEAFRANLANDEANAIRSVALTVKRLPTFGTVVKSEDTADAFASPENRTNTVDNLMSGYDAFIQTLRKLTADVSNVVQEAKDNKAEFLLPANDRVFEGVFSGQSETKYDSDNLPWLPLDSVVASYGGFLADKTGATGDFARKIARVWAKGSEKLDQYMSPLVQPLLGRLTDNDQTYTSTIPEQDDNVIRSAPKRQQRWIRSAGTPMSDQEFSQFFVTGWVPEPGTFDLPVQDLLPAGQFVEEIGHDIVDLPSLLSGFVQQAVKNSAPHRRLEETMNGMSQPIEEKLNGFGIPLGTLLNYLGVPIKEFESSSFNSPPFDNSHQLDLEQLIGAGMNEGTPVNEPEASIPVTSNPIPPLTNLPQPSAPMGMSHPERNNQGPKFLRAVAEEPPAPSVLDMDHAWPDTMTPAQLQKLQQLFNNQGITSINKVKGADTDEDDGQGMSNNNDVLSGSSEAMDRFNKLVRKVIAQKALRDFGDPVYNNPALYQPVPGWTQDATTENLSKYFKDIRNYLKNPVGTIQQTKRDNYKLTLQPALLTKSDGLTYLVMDATERPAKNVTTIYSVDQLLGRDTSDPASPSSVTTTTTAAPLFAPNIDGQKAQQNPWLRLQQVLQRPQQQLVPPMMQPGMQQMMPGMQQGMTQQVPMIQQIMSRNMPQMQQGMPQMQQGMPMMQQSMPGMQQGMPGMPGMQQMMPGMQQPMQQGMPMMQQPMQQGMSMMQQPGMQPQDPLSMFQTLQRQMQSQLEAQLNSPVLGQMFRSLFTSPPYLNDDLDNTFEYGPSEEARNLEGESHPVYALTNNYPDDLVIENPGQYVDSLPLMEGMGWLTPPARNGDVVGDNGANNLVQSGDDNEEKIGQKSPNHNLKKTDDMQTFYNNVASRSEGIWDNDVGQKDDYVALPLPRVLTLDEIAADPDAINRAVADYLNEWQHYVRVVQGEMPGKPEPLEKVVEDVVKSLQESVEKFTANEIFEDSSFGLESLLGPPPPPEPIFIPSNTDTPSPPPQVGSLKKIMFEIMDGVNQMTIKNNRESSRLIRQATDNLGLTGRRADNDRPNLMLLPLVSVPWSSTAKKYSGPSSTDNNPEEVEIPQQFFRPPANSNVPMGSILPETLIEEEGFHQRRRRLDAFEISERKVEWSPGPLEYGKTMQAPPETTRTLKELQSVFDMLVSALQSGYDTLKTQVIESTANPEPLPSVSKSESGSGVSDRMASAAKQGASNFIQKMADGIVKRGPKIKEPTEQEAFTEDLSAFEKTNGPAPTTPARRSEPQRNGNRMAVRSGSVMPNDNLYSYIADNEDEDHLHIPQRDEQDAAKQARMKKQHDLAARSGPSFDAPYPVMPYNTDNDWHQPSGDQQRYNDQPRYNDAQQRYNDPQPRYNDMPRYNDQQRYNNDAHRSSDLRAATDPRVNDFRSDRYNRGDTPSNYGYMSSGGYPTGWGGWGN